MIRTLPLVVAATVALAGVGLVSTPAHAAAPEAAPTVTVSRTASGYQVTWTAVPGATGYRLYTETPVRESQGGAGYLVVGSRMTAFATAPGSARTYRTADVLAPETPAIATSTRFSVAGYNGSGRGPLGGSRAGCAPGYFVSARGSGQNPDASGDNGYAQGMGSRGKRVYEDTRRRLGYSRAQFQAIGINYPAAPVNWRFVDRENYYSSQRAGVSVVQTNVGGIANSCPSSRIVVFGYSQGAHAAGDAVARLTAAQRRTVVSAHLFADALRNPDDAGIQYRPSPTDQTGIMGSRPSFTGLTDRLQVVSWCSSTDDVCSRDSAPTTFHGPRYDCYERWAARDLAARAKNEGWRPGAVTTRPDCTMAG